MTADAWGYVGIGGSVVESSPATRGARVRFPANAGFFSLVQRIVD